jgi:hypothetical protein
MIKEILPMAQEMCLLSLFFVRFDILYIFHVRCQCRCVHSLVPCPSAVWVWCVVAMVGVHRCGHSSQRQLNESTWVTADHRKLWFTPQ